MPDLTFNSDIEAANKLAIDYAEQVRKGKLSPLQSHKCAYIDGYIAGLNFARSVHVQTRDAIGEIQRAVPGPVPEQSGAPLAYAPGSDKLPTA